MATAKERVEQELLELNEKIVKLQAFIDSPKINIVSREMQDDLKRQMITMKDYAEILQHRLSIWGQDV